MQSYHNLLPQSIVSILWPHISSSTSPGKRCSEMCAALLRGPWATAQTLHFQWTERWSDETPQLSHETWKDRTPPMYLYPSESWWCSGQQGAPSAVGINRLPGVPHTVPGSSPQG